MAERTTPQETANVSANDNNCGRATEQERFATLVSMVQFLKAEGYEFKLILPTSGIFDSQDKVHEGKIESKGGVIYE